MTSVEVVGFERMARPLLELVQRVTGLETSFVTLIDWAAQEQEVRLALNTGALEVTEGSVVDWPDSMCRRVLLDGTGCSSDVGTDFPGSIGARSGMRTFCAVPIVEGAATLGTICGASRLAVEVTPDMLLTLRLVAEALAFQMTAQLESRAHRTRAERAEAMALADPLTGLANRRAFSARLEEELAGSGRRGGPVALLVMDVDEFKAVNDTYGHPGGDAVLLALGDVLRRVSRTGDVPARLGGDEFALLLPGSATAGAEAVATRIGSEFRRITRQLKMPSTLSIGVSSSEAAPGPSLLAAADEAMYRGKANGRNRSEVWATCA